MKKCILIFAYNRPNYLDSVLKSLFQCEDLDSWDIKYIQDGPTHEPTKTIAMKHITNYSKPIETLFYPKNAGIGVVQHDALREAFIEKGYDKVLHLEDDLVISKTYLKTIENLLDITDSDPTIATVSGNHKNIKLDESKKYLMNTTEPLVCYPIGTIHSWGFGISRTKFMRVADLYKQAVDLLYRGILYGKRVNSKILEQRKSLGLAYDRVTSQDSTLKLCFIKSGMPNMIYPIRRHSMPIGRIGTHSTNSVFTKYGFDDKTIDYEHHCIGLNL